MSQMQLLKSPKNIQSDVINECSAIIYKKKFTLFIKRTFDITCSLILLVLLSVILLICAIAVATGKDGPVFFKQIRIGRNGKEFKIIKFRTMTNGNNGSGITVNNDSRVTKVGAFLRKYRLDELPQLINVLVGDMSFVGPRPEVPDFVSRYNDDWFATLLVRPGITCDSSIFFANEAELLDNADDAEDYYINTILPKKCQMNIDYIKGLSFFKDIKIMLNTVKKVLN